VKAPERCFPSNNETESMSKAIMKNLFALPAILALAIFCSCQKQPTEAERNAEVERQMQERLATEHQTQEQQQLAQRVAELEAQQKAASDAKTTVATEQAAEEPERHPSSSVSRGPRDTSENEAPADYSTFYSKLEPHGEWRQTSNYGYVWQPREAQSLNWRPYTNGRWVYTDAGWTWISEEPFGWATYHYGRWTRLRNIGWVWVPGDEWAPAWVSWRTSDDYVGWAPLPPEARFERRSGIHNWADNYYDIGPEQYAFVRSNEFGQQRVDRAVLPTARNVVIVNETTNVTNITYNNTTIVNQGPSYDELSRRGARPIERLRLERQVNVNINLNDSRPVVRGDVVQMNAPVILRARTVERPRLVKENIAQVVVEHGWDGIADQQAADKARQKMKSEATPPPNAPPKAFVKTTEGTSASATTAPEPATAAPAAPASTATERHPGSSAAGTRAAAATAAATPTVAATATPKATTAPISSPESPATPTPRSTPAALVHPSATTRPENAGSQNEVQRQFRQRLKTTDKDIQTRGEAPTPIGKIPMQQSSPAPTPLGTATPVPSPVSSPSAAADSGEEKTGQSNRQLRKEEKKERKEERRQQRRGPAESATPSASPAPQ
jgi:hypothetical protein